CPFSKPAAAFSSGMAAAVLSCFMYAYPRVEWATPAESLRERSASGASALAASIAFCEYVTALGRLPGFGSSTYAPAKSNNVGKLFGFAARLFSPYETNRFISLRSDSDIIAYDVIERLLQIACVLVVLGNLPVAVSHGRRIGRKLL